MVRDSAKLRHGLLVGGLFLLLWGGKLVVLDGFNSDLPWWDEWDGIGQSVLVPAGEGTLTLADFFAPHNEHRIAWSRALAVALVGLNGQWDARLACVVNAALHAAIVALAFSFGRNLLPRGLLCLWFLVLAALTGPPVVWENIVRSFDSQHYLLIGFSLAAIAGLLTGAAFSARWWWGLGCAVGALFTMGSGLVAVAVVAITLLACFPPQDWWRVHRWTLLGCLAVLAAGWALRHEVPAHAALRAHTLTEFAIAFWHHLQWPLVHGAWFGAVSWLPWMWLAWRCGRGRAGVHAAERVVVAVGLWALVHYAAMAWLRGSFQPWPPVRGLENVVVGLAVNALALLILWSRVRGESRRRWVTGCMAAVWTWGCGHGLVTILHENHAIVLPGLAAQARRAEERVRAYVETGDRAQLQGPDLPHPSPDALAHYLDQPALRAILPVSVQPGEMARGSRFARWLAARGWFVVGLGSALAVIGWAWPWVRRADGTTESRIARRDENDEPPRARESGAGE